MKMKINRNFLMVITFVLILIILIPELIVANENLCSFDSKDSKDGNGCAKDMNAEIEEIERSPDQSIVHVKVKKRGTYAGSIMFQVCCFSRIAKNRGYRYYTILQERDIEGCMDCEWENEFTLGFMKSKSDSEIQKYREQGKIKGELKIEDINESSMICGFMPVPSTAFGQAVYYGNISELKKLVAENKELLNEKDDSEFMPLHIAAVENQAEIVRCLISSGADIDGKGMFGWSPLHMAIKFNQADIVEILLRLKADPNFKMDLGNTPLHTAAYGGQIKIADMIIKSGAKINETDYEGNTSLHAAASRGHLEMLKFLISKGANRSKLNNQGQKPIFFAEMTKQQDVIDFLNKFEIEK